MSSLAGLAVVLLCSWLNKKAMGWLEWSRARRAEVKQQIAEIERVKQNY